LLKYGKIIFGVHTFLSGTIAACRTGKAMHQQASRRA
jgi:hypothetical protein